MSAPGLGVGLEMWTVYCNPKDYPGLYVARKFLTDGPTLEVVHASTLEGVRNLIPQGLFRMPRAPQDDPVIVEVWL